MAPDASHSSFRRLSLSPRFEYRACLRHHQSKLLKPNPNPPAPMDADIDPNDGYEIIGRGELAKVDETVMSLTCTEHSEDETSSKRPPPRYYIKRPLQARRQSLSKTRTYATNHTNGINNVSSLLWVCSPSYCSNPTTVTLVPWKSIS